MVATNSVAQRSGNVSAGTSAFAMIVLEEPLTKVYPEIDLVTTPSGDLVGMVHTNNCTSEINAWVKLFREFADAAGMKLSTEELFATLFNEALKGIQTVAGCFLMAIILVKISLRSLKDGRFSSDRQRVLYFSKFHPLTSV